MILEFGPYGVYTDVTGSFVGGRDRVTTLEYYKECRVPVNCGLPVRPQLPSEILVYEGPLAQATVVWS